MKYSIGYQLPDEFNSISEICRDYSDNISNVYFSFADEKSGRLPLCDSSKLNVEAVKKIQIQELKEIKAMGKTLTLLLNSNCYGNDAVSLALRNRIDELCTYLKEQVDIDTVTTTSPFIASVIKENFKDSIKVIASVNMRISTVRAMQQLSSYFDGYYMAKECNRDFSKINELYEWCNKNGKKLCILANSGCMPYCGFQTFHDNFVAHQDVNSVDDTGWEGLPSPCHKFISSMKAFDGLACFMQGTWIRPEDTSFYSDYFDEMKLATRMHSRMRMIVSAYARGNYRGNLLDLTEPSFSRDFKGVILDNTVMPEDFFQHVTNCTGNCENCGYCKSIAEKVFVKI